MFHELQHAVSRRQFLTRTASGLGGIALASLMNESAQAQTTVSNGLPGLPHFAPRAKRVIYLFQSGAPSQIDLFDHKPALADRRGSDLPDSICQGQRLTAMTATQDRFPIA